MANYYLIGMMGCGKSVTGRALAQKMKYSFLDLDQLIEKQHGKTIAEIFTSAGELKFREYETTALKGIGERESTVIATGGGVILNPDNVAWMKTNGRVIYLRATLETLWQRVSGRTTRPLLTTENPKKTLETLLECRKAIYEASCDHAVDTDGCSSTQAADRILKLVEKTQ